MTPSWLPVAGRTSDGAHYAVGFNGHGVAQAPYLGSLIADEIAGEPRSDDLEALWRDTPRFLPAPIFSAPMLRLGWALDRAGDRLANRASDRARAERRGRRRAQSSGVSIRSASPISRCTRAGLPWATTPAGRSRVTTAPAPTTVFSPIETPGQTITPAPSQTPSASVDRVRHLPGVATGDGVDRVGRGDQLDARCEQALAPDRDRRAVEHRAVGVDEGLLPDRDPVAEVAEERRADLGVLAELAEQLLQRPPALVRALVADRVELLDERLATVELRVQLGVVAAIELAPPHPLFHLAHRATI